jgi:hypothetical protein
MIMAQLLVSIIQLIKKPFKCNEMRTLKLIIAGLLILFASNTQAQVSFRVNIGTPPAWGPEVEADVRYYYLPDVDAYYDLNSSMFVYCHNGNWIHRRQLPGRFRNYNLYQGHKVVVRDYRGNAPYTYCNYHKNRAKGHDYDRLIERTGRQDHRYSENNDRGRGEGNRKSGHDNGNRHDD